MNVELECLFSGRVQGVGFRWTCLRLLQDRGLDGHVRNLVDGRVELRLQGPRDQLIAAVQLVRDRMDRYIENVQVEEREIDEPLGPFRVR